MNNIYQLVIEHNNFYDTKEFDSYLFENEKDAIAYMHDLMEAYKQDFMDNYDCETEDQLMNEYIEITEESDRIWLFLATENFQHGDYREEFTILIS